MPTSEKPILMSAPMVNAILSGAKTQTRRVVKWSAKSWENDGAELLPNKDGSYWPYNCSDGNQRPVKCPYGHPGDLLWVRETFATDGTVNSPVAYRATPDAAPFTVFKWKPSIFMPRWASRITLKVESVRLQRLQDISDDDCRAEGVFGYPAGYYKGCWQSEFSLLWDSINKKKHPWSENPWVWAITFTKEDNG